jgi:Family of unknown function (DUF6174)
MKIIFAKLRLNNIKKILLTFLMLTFVIIGSSCTPTFVKILQENRSKWENQNITHYQMMIDFPANGFTDRMPLTIEVKDGKVISMVDVNGEKLPLTKDFRDEFVTEYPDAFTIPGLFSFAEKIYEEKPAEIDVSYDPELGYPTTIFVDPFTEPCCQDFAFEVQKIQILQP